jgi:hypothetical protein
MVVKSVTEMVTWMHAANWDASVLLRNRPLSITQMYPKLASIIIARQYSPHQLATTCPFAPKKTATTLIIFQRENYHCRSPLSLHDVQWSPVERPGIPHWDSGRYTATLALRPPVPRLVILNECPRHKNNKVMRSMRNTAVFEFGVTIRAVQHLGRVNRVRTQTVHLRRYIKLLVCTGDETVGSTC